MSSIRLSRLHLLRGLATLALSLNELGVDVGEDTTRGDRDLSEELVELLVVSDSELNVSWDDSLLLPLLGGVTGQLEDLSDEVLKDGSKIDRGASTDSLGVTAVLQKTTNSTNRELESSLGALGLGTTLLNRLSSTSLSFSGHIQIPIKLSYSNQLMLGSWSRLDEFSIGRFAHGKN